MNLYLEIGKEYTFDQYNYFIDQILRENNFVKYYSVDNDSHRFSLIDRIFWDMIKVIPNYNYSSKAVFNEEMKAVIEKHIAILIFNKFS